MKRIETTIVNYKDLLDHPYRVQSDQPIHSIYVKDIGGNSIAITVISAHFEGLFERPFYAEIFMKNGMSFMIEDNEVYMGWHVTPATHFFWRKQP